MPLPLDGWVQPTQAGAIAALLPEPFVVEYRDGRGVIENFVSHEGAGGEVVADEEVLRISIIQDSVFVALLVDTLMIFVPELIISMLGLHTQESMVSSGTDISVADGEPTDLILSFFQLHTQRRGERIGRGERRSSVDHREWGNK